MDAELNEIKSLLEQRESLTEEIARKREELCEKYHPLKIGDVVFCNSGYAHIGKKIRVKRVWFGKGRFGSVDERFFASGTVLKKDLSEGCFAGEWAQKVSDTKGALNEK